MAKLLRLENVIYFFIKSNSNLLEREKERERERERESIFQCHNLELRDCHGDFKLKDI